MLPERCSVKQNKKDCVNPPEYVIEVIHIDEEYLNGDFATQKSNLQRQAISNVNNASYNALKEAAEVQDNRSDFY